MASRAGVPRRSGHTKQFARDWKRLERSGRFPMEELLHVMQLLIENRGPLPPEYLDHPLKGEWHDFRDCHIRGDWILIYRIDETRQGAEVIFVRTGTHADLFK